MKQLELALDSRPIVHRDRKPSNANRPRELVPVDEVRAWVARMAAA